MLINRKQMRIENREKQKIRLQNKKQKERIQSKKKKK